MVAVRIDESSFAVHLVAAALTSYSDRPLLAKLSLSVGRFLKRKKANERTASKSVV